MDTGAICQYLANTLKAAQSYDLVVLKSMVEEMTVRCSLEPLALVALSFF